MKKNLYSKVKWIWDQMPDGTDIDDVHDVLLGNITNPSQFVAQVESLASEWDDDYESNMVKIRKYYD